MSHYNHEILYKASPEQLREVMEDWLHRVKRYDPDMHEELEADLKYLKATDEEKDYNTVLSKQTAKAEGGSTGCTYCKHCAPCPVGIDIAAVNELLDEVQQNGGVVSDEIAAKYKKLEHHASDCVGCGQCEDRCPFGVPVREKMDEAQTAFGY